MIDLEENKAFFWVKTTQHLPVWLLAAPLRSVFHWWMEKNGAQLLHAAAVGNESGAVLITGKGGVGKSTTALSCLKNGMLYLGDDYLIVRNDPFPTVQSLYGTAKLKPEDLRRFPSLEPFVKKEDGVLAEKLIFFLYPGLQHQMVRSLPVKAVLKPDIVDRPLGSVSPISFRKIHGAISFTTMSQLPYAGEYTQMMITELIQKLPCYQLHVGSDLESNARMINDFLDGTLDVAPMDHFAITDERRPLISVVIPVFNGEKFIHDAVETVQKQNYPALEIIFVDDGSTDQSARLIGELLVDYRYFYQENQGPAIARNRGIKEASGEFITFLDVDDLWPDNNLHYLMDEMLSEETLLVVHGYAQNTEKNKNTGDYEYVGNPLESFPGYLGAGLYRREAFSVVGMFDPLFAYTGEDADWFKRASELGIPLRKLEEVTLYVRRHGENMTEGRTLVELNALKVFKRSLDRVRNPYQKKSVTLDVSVIMPVYNTEKYIAEAINSILMQDHAYKEVLIVDDGSTDETVRIAERFIPLIRLLSQENKGAASARNTGIEEACGRYITFMDADDRWAHGHTRCLLDALEKYPDCDLAMGKLEQFISPELVSAHHHNIREEVKVVPGYHPGCVLIKREVFEKIGLFREDLKLAEVVDFFARIENAGLKICHVDEVVYHRRIHETNQGLLKKQFLPEYASVLRDKLAALKKLDSQD